MRTLIPAVSILLLATGQVASADVVTLTSGEMFTYWDGSDTHFNVAGSGFAADGLSTGGHFGLMFNAGDMVALADTLHVSRSLSPLHGNGSVTIDGQRQEGYFLGSFQFTATPFVAELKPGSTVLFSTPFTGQGTVQLFAGVNDTQPLISQDVIGSGVLSFEAIQAPPGHYNATRSILTLTFEPESPTPEPASMLLLGSGLAAAWQSRRLRRAVGAR